MKREFCYAILALGAAAVRCLAQAGDVYKEAIQPILARNCAGCHGGNVKQGGVDLSSFEAMMRGGDSGPVIIPGKAGESRLFKRITFQEAPGMPMNAKQLPAETIARIEQWINAGAPGSTQPVSAAPKQPDHWAFRIPKQPAVPTVKNAAWVRNPVDAFIAAEHEKRGLKPAPEADRRTLLRRVYLDLVGLPPTTDQVQAFLADRSPAAYEKVVDQLLASQRYGERWGRHWMDIWRYSDWYGWRKNNQVRYSQRHIWRWRDWIIESLNQDKGYDQMIREMLAGDEIAPEDPQITRATGYLARNWYLFSRNVWIQDTAEYTAAAFLGVTMKCARCHSHKYDPITQTEYYRFKAFFESFEVRTDHVAGETNTEKDGLVRIYDAHADNPTYRLIRGDDQKPDTSVALTPGVPEIFGPPNLKIHPVTLSRVAYYPDSRPFVYEDLLAQAKKELQQAEEELIKAKDALANANSSKDAVASSRWAAGKDTKPDQQRAEEAFRIAEKKTAAARADVPALEARIRAEKARYAVPAAPDADKLAVEALQLERKANILKADESAFRAQLALEAAKGDAKRTAGARKDLEAAVAVLSRATDNFTPVGPSYSETSTGRRLALANWIAAKQNPLTARVAVNHIWLRHFGRALVPTVFNFGTSGKAPSHPELLDWLATEFMARNWSMKAIHRIIVTSSTYRMQSSGWEAHDSNATIDPDNQYLWRANVRRMEAEVVRDALLQVAGKLDTSMGGAELDVASGETVYRRSVYFRQAPDTQMNFLRVFDAANPNECFERGESVAPHQALALANSQLALDVSRMLASELEASNGSNASGFVAAAFAAVLGRPPASGEAADSAEFLKQQAILLADAGKLKAFAGPSTATPPAASAAARARENLVHVLLNHNDFVTVR